MERFKPNFHPVTVNPHLSPSDQHPTPQGNLIILSVVLCGEGLDGQVVLWSLSGSSAQVMISLVHELEPHVGLCADTSEPGACFVVCVSHSLPLPPPQNK